MHRLNYSECILTQLPTAQKTNIFGTEILSYFYATHKYAHSFGRLNIYELMV